MLALLLAFVSQTPTRNPVALVHATVITMADHGVIRDGTVLIDGDRIVAVGQRGSVPIPAGARVIDATGKFVIPGLWDMHAHTSVPGGEGLLGLYVANGVTGVRDMGGDYGAIVDWRKRIRAGTLTGPRIIASGPYVQGGDAALPHFVVRTPAEATASVDSLGSLGVDFVKVHELVPRDAFFALARAARARGLFLAGHVQDGVTNEEAADSGQRSLEHLKGFPNQCTPSDSARLAGAHILHRIVLESCTTADQSTAYRRLALRKAWVTPTFMAGEMIAALPGTRLPSDSLLRYLPAFLREAMAAALEIPADMPADGNVLGQALYRKRFDVVRGLFATGVPILAGTDAPLPNSIPGFGLHEELAALVRAGLTPRQALAAATSEAARYFGVDTLGTICTGCVADLVVLDVDPLVQIQNTRRIWMVVAGGRTYARSDLSSLKVAALKAAAARP
jgi:hypothetical protein